MSNMTSSSLFTYFIPTKNRFYYTKKNISRWISFISAYFFGKVIFFNNFLDTDAKKIRYETG